MKKNTVKDIPPLLQEVLGKFKVVFHTPMGLLPVRGREHAVVLKDEMSPINVRPYRYPHFQKTEVEKLVSEMLVVGIIQMGTNPFPSSVLLVKKKDGSWGFYVDYWALNKTIVLDKYLIPIIDGLLDELNGAKIFSKLDLRSGYH